MASYINKNHRGVLEADAIGDVLGKTYEEYLSGMWIRLTKSQLAFMEANPTATHKEIIAKQLEPPPPEPSLSERKEQAVDQVKRTATGKMTELFPVTEVVVNGFLKDETESVAFFLGYSEMAEAISSYLEAALKGIEDAEDNGGITLALDAFNVLINRL